jgi:hypothetical protein
MVVVWINLARGSKQAFKKAGERKLYRSNHFRDGLSRSAGQLQLASGGISTLVRAPQHEHRVPSGRSPHRPENRTVQSKSEMV